MKTQLSIIFVSIILSIMPTNLQVSASQSINPRKNVSFDCRLNNKDKFVTTISVEGRRKTQDILEWKGPLRGMSPQKRCAEAAQRIQLFWNRRAKFSLAFGMDSSNGDGLICGIYPPKQTCTPDENLLFRFKNKAEAEDIISNLYEQIQHKNMGVPIKVQTSSPGSIDMNALVDLTASSD
jgi:hypothetical protein